MPEQIRSRNQLFYGKLIDKPPVALHAADGVSLVCPHCRKAVDPEDCDVLGAEPDCVFCFQCNREFEMP